MKTVIIHSMSDETQKFLDRYYVLFQPFVESGQIAFCAWDESAKAEHVRVNEDGGDIISLALPDLRRVIQGEKHWRAIVVLPVEEYERDGHRYEVNQCRLDNPFDFIRNANVSIEEGPNVEESEIPLVRLAQMLGGIPLPSPHTNVSFVKVSEQKFGPHETDVFEEHYEYQTQIVEKAEAQKKIWDELNDRYSTSCVLPDSLYLFKGMIKPGIVIPEDKDTEVLNRTECDSSMFWYRNAYPAKARFLTKGFHRPGNAYYHEDLFTFWMTTLTLAINEFPSGTFEAYKLYDTNAVVSAEMVQTIFSQYFDRLSRVKYTADMRIIDLKKSMQVERKDDTLPYYSVHIPVEYRHMNDDNLLISDKKLGLANDCPIEEEYWWYKVTRLSRKAMDKLISSTRSVLDHASKNCIALSQMSEEELVEIDEYQVEEMDEELSELESEILTFTRGGMLPVRLLRSMQEKRKAETATRMRKHVSKKMAIATACIGMGIYLLGFAPDIITRAINSAEYQPIVAALLGVLLLAVTAFCTLLWFRHTVRVKIHDYNGTMRSILDTIQASADHFSKYLSKCCSYMRGRSLVQLLVKRALVARSGIQQMIEHSRALGEYMDLIKSWLGDFNQGINEKAIYDGIVYFNFDVPPENNPEYQLNSGGRTQDVLSVGGGTSKAPYQFIKQFSVKRISVFEPSTIIAEEKKRTPAQVKQPRPFDLAGVTTTALEYDAEEVQKSPEIVFESVDISKTQEMIANEQKDMPTGDSDEAPATGEEGE